MEAEEDRISMEIEYQRGPSDDDNLDEAEDDSPDPEESDPVIENPVKDVAVCPKLVLCLSHFLLFFQVELDLALSEGLDFQGNFYFNKTYNDAPNPVLQVGSLGHVGLPLSERDAKAIIAESSQAPYGKGELTIVDREVRDTWEVDAPKVSENQYKHFFMLNFSLETQISFGNPAWDVFIRRSVQEVCAGLGVNYAASQPRCELYKLLLYETGSQCVF
jgi:hypothetical protein